jgi:hypothetical protein
MRLRTRSVSRFARAASPRPPARTATNVIASTATNAAENFRTSLPAWRPRNGWHCCRTASPASTCPLTHSIGRARPEFDQPVGATHSPVSRLLDRQDQVAYAEPTHRSLQLAEESIQLVISPVTCGSRGVIETLAASAIKLDGCIPTRSGSQQWLPWARGGRLQSGSKAARRGSMAEGCGSNGRSPPYQEWG